MVAEPLDKSVVHPPTTVGEGLKREVGPWPKAQPRELHLDVEVVRRSPSTARVDSTRSALPIAARTAVPEGC